MRIHVRSKNFTAVAMSFSLSRLQDDCTAQSPKIIEHAIKILAYPSVQEQDHWRSELYAFFTRFHYTTKAEAKQPHVYRWLYDRTDLHAWYNVVTETMKETNFLTWEEVEPKLKKFAEVSSQYLTVNVNRKRYLPYSTAVINAFLAGHYPKS